MAKVTLYVPDDLWRRAQAVSDELNLSQVFQTALQAELRRVRRRRQEQADLDALLDLEALRKRFTQQQAELYRQGYEVGIRCANEFSYADLRFYESVEWDPDQLVRNLPAVVSKAVSALEPGAPRGTGGAMEVHQGLADALRRIWELAVEDAVEPGLPARQSARPPTGSDGRANRHETGT